MRNVLASEWHESTPPDVVFQRPAPIADHDIARRIEADVVVIGAGFAGLCAAAAAAERGARTILIEKGAAPSWRGLRVGGVGDRMQREVGLNVDRQEIIAEMMRWSGYKADQRLVTMWVDQSGAALDWVYDRLDEAGVALGRVPVDQQVLADRDYTYYPITNMILDGGHEQLSKVLQKANEDRGVDFHFNTSASQLIQSRDGRVTGVVAKTAAGELVRYEAAGGVVLCTGDYGHDPDMVRTFAPHAQKTFWNLYMPPNNTGDGHKMGMWAGAAMDEAPHCALIFDIAVVDSPRPMLFPLGRQPFLNVNQKGERYVNEELPFAFTCRADSAQPGGYKWVIWDAKWREDTARFAAIICKSMQAPMFPEDLAFLLENDVIKTAATLQELAAKTDLPPDALAATVARYNELARGGKDLDFGKVANCLSTIEQGPFYAVKMGPALLVTLGGLKINTELQVLDTAGEPIPGLYAAGNTSGGFFANDYPINVSGISHGRAITFGRLAGQQAAMAAVAAKEMVTA